MVCWLVEEDHVDAVETDELPCEGEFGLFTTREFVHGHVHGVLVEAEALENALGDAGDIAPTAGGERLLEFGVAFHDRFPITFVEGGVDHLGFDGGDFILEFLELTAFTTEFFLDGRVRFKVSNLGEVSEANARGKFHVARVLLLLADGVQERGFARTVVTDDTDTVAIVHLEVDVLKHVHCTKGTVNRLHVDEFTCHVRPPFERRG